jgi:hypothetical protein
VIGLPVLTGLVTRAWPGCSITRPRPGRTDRPDLQTEIRDAAQLPCRRCGERARPAISAAVCHDAPLADGTFALLATLIK